MNQSMLPYNVSANEVTLIQELRELNYGDALDIESSKQSPDRTFLVTSKEANFLKALRGAGKLAKVVIHDGEPTMAEQPDQTPSGRKILRKFRF